ncbi:hypothetical protein AB0L56_00185 [Streptomyces sp. NPDC052079]|uniref:hypothetical protein n=1 Tax=Streptomyces sp. NPDC052079 TaxID=3155526 RepID=UPI003412057C
MKIQERSGAGGGRSAAPVGPVVGDRLPTPPRERKPALAALAVLLILVGALGVTTLVLRAGERIEVIKLTDTVPEGEAITDGQITSVMVNEDSSANFVPWEQRDSLKKLQAKSTLYKGTVLVGEMFAEGSGLQQGEATVGVSLKEGQYPSHIKSGDHVAVYRVGDEESGAAGAGSALLVERAVVADVTRGNDDVVSSSNLPVELTVDASRAAALAQAASAGEVAVVLIPGD